MRYQIRLNRGRDHRLPQVSISHRKTGKRLTARGDIVLAACWAHTPAQILRCARGVLALPLELPGSDHAARETEADAAVRLEVARRRRPRVPRQVVWRGDEHAAHLFADAHRDHVAFDTLAG